MSIGETLVARAGLPRRANGSLRRSFPDVLGALIRGVGFLLAGLATIGVCRGQEEPRPAGDRAEKRVVRVFGVVRDASDRPVSEATVWLAESDARGGRPLSRVAETRSEADGAFSFYEAVRKGEVFYLIARDSQGRLGWSSSLIRPGQNMIRLREVGDVHGRVVDGDGQAIAGAAVTPKMFQYLPPGEHFSSDFTELFAELAADFETHTAADGSFVLHRVPKDAHVSCEVSAPGFGRPRATFAAHDSVTIKLQRAGRISGALGPLAGVEAARGGYKLRLSLHPPERDSDLAGLAKLNCFETLSTDDDGAFRSGELPPGRYSITAVNGQGRPFFAHPAKYAEVKPEQTTEGVSVPLVPTVRVTGQVIERETRKGIAGVELWAYQQSQSADRSQPAHSQFMTTDDEGRFEFRLPAGATRVGRVDIPREFIVPADRPADLTEREIADGDEWPTIELTRAAEVEGVVVDETGEPAPHAELFIDNLSGASGRPFDWLPNRTDGNGRFVIGQLDPELKFSLRARTPDAVTNGMATIALSELQGPAKITVSKKHLFRLRGKVVDAAGQPLPEATISLQWSHEVHNDLAAQMARGRGAGIAAQRFGPIYQRSQLEPFAASADGKFESPALWPRDSYYATVSAPGYASLDTAQVQGTAGGVHDFGAIVLRRNDLVVSGVVVNERGQAVADAEIAVVLPVSSPKSLVRSDSQGRFALANVDASVPLALRARTAATTTNGAAVVLPADFDQPVRLVVSPRHAFRLRGKLLDRQGKPAPGARVSVVWNRRGADDQTLRRFVSMRPTLPSGGLVTLDQIAAEADGSFSTPALWPDEDYHLVASAPGFAANESAVVYGAAGKPTTLEPLVLTRNNFTITGQVVDSNGRPLAGVAVSNSGDSDKPLVSTTGADGRFALEGLYEGQAYLLARLQGYRATGWRGAAGGSPIEIVLTADDEPIRRIAPPKLDAAARFVAEKELARRLLDELWALRERFDDNPRGAAAPRFGQAYHRSPAETAARAAKYMARLDLDRALAWSTSEGGLFDEIVRVEAVAGDFENDADRAISLLRGKKTHAARSALLAMARRAIAAGKHEQAIRLLEAALTTAPSQSAFYGLNARMQESDLASARAKVGALAIRAERVEWSAKLLTQAADWAEKDAAGDSDAGGRVAAALAVLDPQRALRLLRSTRNPAGPANSPDYSYAGQAAAAVGPKDLRSAQEFLNLLQIREFTDRARMQVASRLADQHWEAAVRLVDEMNQLSLWIKADSLCWIALALASNDPEHAYALLDSALEQYFNAVITGSSVLGGRPVEAARVALAARAVGYPDVPNVIDRVLALRVTYSGPTAASMEMTATINTARLLALVDPAVARELLTSFEAKTQLITPKVAVTNVGRGEWLQAWALADLQEAERRCDEELAKLKNQSTIDTASLALLPLVELLVTPLEERERYLLRSIDPRYWFPGDDEP